LKTLFVLWFSLDIFDRKLIQFKLKKFVFASFHWEDFPHFPGVVLKLIILSHIFTINKHDIKLLSEMGGYNNAENALSE